MNLRTLFQQGGRGSGHHGHAGRPGKRGGSLPSKARVEDYAVTTGAKTFGDYWKIIKERGIPMKWKKGTKDKSMYGGDIDERTDESTWDDFDFIAWGKKPSYWDPNITQYDMQMPKDLIADRFQIQGTVMLTQAFRSNHAGLEISKDVLDQRKFSSPKEYISFVEGMIKDEMDRNHVFLRTTPGRLDKFLYEGEYMNMFQRGGKTSISTAGKGFTKSDYWDRRVQGEFEILGLPTSTPHEMRPVYGYLSKKDDGRLTTGPLDWSGLTGKFEKAKDPLADDFWLEQYGSVAIRLKSDVKERTTWTGGDSLDMHGSVVSSLTNSPSYFSIREASDASFIIMSDTNGKGLDSDWGQYWEAQIYGGVMPDDIDHVYMKKEPTHRLKKLMEKRGIQWTVTG